MFSKIEEQILGTTKAKSGKNLLKEGELLSKRDRRESRKWFARWSCFSSVFYCAKLEEEVTWRWEKSNQLIRGDNIDQIGEASCIARAHGVDKDFLGSGELDFGPPLKVVDAHVEYQSVCSSLGEVLHIPISRCPEAWASRVWLYPQLSFVLTSGGLSFVWLPIIFLNNLAIYNRAIHESLGARGRVLGFFRCLHKISCGQRWLI